MPENLFIQIRMILRKGENRLVYNKRMSVHLYVRSSYTLLSSTIRIKELVKEAKQLGYTALALTDHHVMYGAASFIDACRAAGIKPIVGLEADCLYHDSTVPFLLLAKNAKGYMNLMKLSSWLCGGHDTCSLEQLREAAGNCFLIVYGEGGWMDSKLVSSDIEGVREMILTMRSELPPFDIALSYQDALLWQERNSWLKRLARSEGIPTVALNKVMYLREQDAHALRILTGIRLQKTLHDPSLSVIGGRYLLPQEKMEQLYEKDDLARTDAIAAECTGNYDLPKTSLPVYQNKENVSSKEYLEALCYAGLKKRLQGQRKPEYIERLRYELSVIEKMHFEDYFLIVYDFILYARRAGIYVGPGRGSAAGSLVAYCLGITMIDPIRYDLLFERFLNPERVSMPDIDTDIPDNRRDEVIAYVAAKYGHERVANIITFGTLGARQVLRDVGKVLNINNRDIDMLVRLIPNTAGMTLRKAWDSSARLRQTVQADDRFRSLFACAVQLEGLPRHASIHAAGILLSSVPIANIVPTAQLTEGMITSQYTMEHLEKRGLIKMDFLGLRNLTIIDAVVRRINKSDPDFKILNIPLDEPRVYELFEKADTIGVFQFESAGMKDLLRRIRPKNYDDIAACLALYRPASMESIPAYIENRKNPDRIRYPSDELRPVLYETYGIMIYQEQAMKTAEIAAGFSLGRADVLRKAMSKKKEDEVQALKDEFIRGCLRNGYTQDTASELFELVSRFAGYGFNKSHAVAYALVAYQMAYLKAVYPMEFYPAILDSVIGDEAKTSQYIDEARRRGITVLAPDVNRSGAGYAVRDQKIMLPLSVVKGVGIHAAREIMKERQEGGQFIDFYDFTARVLIRRISRAMIESLIDAGALDSLGLGRRTMKASLDEAISYSELIQVRSGQLVTVDLGLLSKPVPIRMKDEPQETADLEKEALGFNIGVQPIVLLRNELGIEDPTLAAITSMHGRISGFARIAGVHEHRTKKGDMMAFLRLSDETGEMDMAVMPNLYRDQVQNLLRGSYIRFDAKISDKGSLLADRIQVVRKK